VELSCQAKRLLLFCREAMRLLDRYIFVEWVKVFGISLTATLGILLLEDIYSSLPELMRYEVGLLGVLRYYALLIPGFLPLVVPVSLLVSLLFLLGNLHRNQEIVAMRAMGMSILQISRSLWFVGIVLTGVLFYLNAQLVPWSVERSQGYKKNLRFVKEAQEGEDVGIIENLAFDNPQNGHLWVINRFSEYTYQGYGVNVYVRDAYGLEQKRIMAREAYFDEQDKQWHFIDGRELLFAQGTEEPIRSILFDKKVFEDLKESPEVMVNLSRLPEDLSILEIGALLDKVPPEHNPQMSRYAVRYYNIMASPFVCLVVVGIAVPLAVGSVRTNPLVSVSKAALLFFLYYIIESISDVLGAQGLIVPVLAAWLPNLIMLGLAIWYYRKLV